MKKMTYAQALTNAIAALKDNAAMGETVERLNALVNSLNKKNATERKPSATQVANEGFKTAILDFLQANAPRMFTISEIVNAVPVLRDEAGMPFSTSKMSALMRQLIDEGNGPVEKVIEKRRTYFRAKTM